MISILTMNPLTAPLVSDDEHSTKPLSPKRCLAEEATRPNKRAKRVSYVAARDLSTNDSTDDLEIRVPQDFSSVEDAVHFCNHEFIRAALRSETDKKITIHIDPRGFWDIESPLVVNAVGVHSSLVLASSSNSAAHLSMDTQTPNQPLLKVIAGNVTLQDVSLEHCSRVELLTLSSSNNAAVVIDRDAKSSSLTLNNVELRSYSGRGLINRNSDCKVVNTDSYIGRPLY